MKTDLNDEKMKVFGKTHHPRCFESVLSFLRFHVRTLKGCWSLIVSVLEDENTQNDGDFIFNSVKT